MKILAAFLVLIIMALAGANGFAQAPAVEKSGVLLLCQNGSQVWEKTVKDAVAGLPRDAVVETVFGGDDERAMRGALGRLEKLKISKIIVIPVFASSYSPELDQARYMLGIRRTAPPATGPHGGAGSGPAKTIEVKHRLIMTRALDTDNVVIDAVAAAVTKHARDTGSVSLVLAGLGPYADKDVAPQAETLSFIARKVKEKLKLADARAVLLRSDSGEKTRDSTTGELRQTVQELSRQGKTIVVAHTLSANVLDRTISQDLNGLFYTWGETAVLNSLQLRTWLESKITKAGNTTGKHVVKRLKKNKIITTKTR